jgi:hypothetical protein
MMCEFPLGNMSLSDGYCLDHLSCCIFRVEECRFTYWFVRGEYIIKRLGLVWANRQSNFALADISLSITGSAT